MTVNRLFPLEMAWYRDHEIHQKVARQWSLELSRKVLLGVIDHLKNQSVNREENSIPDILIPNKPANVVVGMSMELKKGISFFFLFTVLGTKSGGANISAGARSCFACSTNSSILVHLGL